MTDRKVIVITGPTASGKTSLALKTAEKITSKTGKPLKKIFLN